MAARSATLLIGTNATWNVAQHYQHTQREILYIYDVRGLEGLDQVTFLLLLYRTPCRRRNMRLYILGHAEFWGGDIAQFDVLEIAAADERFFYFGQAGQLAQRECLFRCI